MYINLHRTRLCVDIIVEGPCWPESNEVHTFRRCPPYRRGSFTTISKRPSTRFHASWATRAPKSRLSKECDNFVLRTELDRKLRVCIWWSLKSVVLQSKSVLSVMILSSLRGRGEFVLYSDSDAKRARAAFSIVWTHF